jgi:hypothetical protein
VLQLKLNIIQNQSLEEEIKIARFQFLLTPLVRFAFHFIDRFPTSVRMCGVSESPMQRLRLNVYMQEMSGTSHIVIKHLSRMCRKKQLKSHSACVQGVCIDTFQGLQLCTYISSIFAHNHACNEEEAFAKGLKSLTRKGRKYAGAPHSACCNLSIYEIVSQPETYTKSLVLL